MLSVETALNQPPPSRLNTELPSHPIYYSSPSDWRNEVLYFLLPDRFSDGNESSRPLINRKNLWSARAGNSGNAWSWLDWAQSGALRWQGGTLTGITSKLDYLNELGVTAVWIGPVFKQRGHQDTYHGYGIQNFLDVDPRFGTRRDLVELIAAAHLRGMRIILDIIFNHSGANWNYPGNKTALPYLDYPQRYEFGNWLDCKGLPTSTVSNFDDGVFPLEFQNADYYSRAGWGNLGNGSINDPNAEHKRSDFIYFRDFSLDTPHCLNDLAQCYKYWIALTDCDGFRIDTLKHVSLEQARNFCGSIKEFAAQLGKEDFFLVGEIAGGDYNADRYLDVLDRNLNAALDIGEMKVTLNKVSRGLVPPSEYFNGFDSGNAVLGSHRNLGKRHVSILDDHDQVFGDKIRLSSLTESENAIVPAVALQLFTLGIPCIYYGTEQSFAGPEAQERHWLPGWNNPDYKFATRYLREAMFGPEHPLKSGLEGLPSNANRFDELLPGFGAFGTAGRHCFDSSNKIYKKISLLTGLRKNKAVLRAGRQYQRPTTFDNGDFEFSLAATLAAWSRILDQEECLCIINLTDHALEDVKVFVDNNLNRANGKMEVILNTAEVNNQTNIFLPIGSVVEVGVRANRTAFVHLEQIESFETIVLTNRG